MSLRLFIHVLFLALAPFVARAEGPDEPLTEPLPVHSAKDPAAPELTEDNLLASDRFWPYQVALATEWKPAERAEVLPAATIGVLVRVEASGIARIDFGRDGLFDVPVAATDLVARANQVRTGALEKMAPNFVLAIGPRLLDAAAETPQPVRAAAFSEPRVFLSVFADPEADDFGAMARSLAPLRERAGVMTVLFPQGAHPDAEVREKLRALGWPVAFVHDHLADAYTPSLLGAVPTPAVLLATDEGRALLREAWTPALVAEIGLLLDAAR